MNVFDDTRVVELGGGMAAGLAKRSVEKKHRPGSSEMRLSMFDDVGSVHAEMDGGTLPSGNAAVLIGAPESGLGCS
jgi:hypothetical protein